MISGVTPSLFGLLGHAPHNNRQRIISISPHLLAICSAVMPLSWKTTNNAIIPLSRENMQRYYAIFVKNQIYYVIMPLA